MSVLTVNNLCKNFGVKVILDNVSFTVNKNERVALIGDNGEGKTTLFRVLTKEILPDGGSFSYDNKCQIGYLSQDVIKNDENTLFEEMLLSFSRIVKIEKQMDELIEKMTSNNEKDNELYYQLQEEYQFLGGYDYKYQIESLLNRFGFNATFYNRQIKTFSGGEKTRACLVKLLLSKPNILLLDEPTNHLDLVMIDWLEKFLKNYPGTVFFISHDQMFINDLATKILEIEDHKVTSYSGNYSYYEKEKVLRYEQAIKAFNVQDKLIKRYEMLIRKFKPKPTKTSFAASLENKLSKIEKIEKPNNRKRTIKASFDSELEHRCIMYKIIDLEVGYDKPLNEPLSLDIYNTDKICIMGQNGCGKTTLIQCLINNSHLLKGQAINVRDSSYFYFDQNKDVLDNNKTVFATIQDQYPMMDNTEVRNLLGRFLFIEDDVFKVVDTLSGGEKMRLTFALLSLEKYQILFLDEPTNHLDFSTKKILADLLEDYNGTIIMVSHDRYFVNRFVNKVIYIQNGKYIIEKGNYNDFIALHEIENDAFSYFKKNREKNTSKDDNKPNKVKQNKKKDIEKDIEKKEAELKALNEKMESNEEYDWVEYRELAHNIKELEDELHYLLTQLEDLTE